MSNEGYCAASFNVVAISARNKILNRLDDPDGGVYSMKKLADIAINAIKAENNAAKMKCLFVMSKMKEAPKVPKMIAKKVKDVIKPLAFDILSVDTNSGRMPYFDGPKIALSVAIKNRTQYDPILLSY